MTAVLCADKLSVDGTGSGLAKNLKGCYEPLKLTVGEYKAQLTGMGWDGQYFHLGVPEEFA